MILPRFLLTWLAKATVLLFRCSNLLQKAGGYLFALGCVLLVVPAFFSHGSAHRVAETIASYSVVALAAGVALALLSVVILMTPLLMTRSKRIHSYLLRTRDEASNQERESAVALLESA